MMAGSWRMFTFGLVYAVYGSLLFGLVYAMLEVNVSLYVVWFGVCCLFVVWCMLFVLDYMYVVYSSLLLLLLLSVSLL